MRPLFFEPSVAVVKLIFAVLFSISFMIFDAHLHKLVLPRQLVKLFLTPIEWIANAPAQGFDWTFKKLLSRKELEKQIENLTQENIRLRSEQIRLNSLEIDNIELRRLLNVKNDRLGALLQARVTAVATDPFVKRITVNRGILAGVEVGYPVLAAEGLVGQVVRVYPHVSEVLLIIDNTHRLPVRIRRTRRSVIANGTGHMGNILINNVSFTADIEVGDLIETSGLGGRFSRGIPVAVVEEVFKTDGAPFVKVSASPLAPMDHLEFLMIAMR